jgi:hypothetical protein
VCPITSMSSSCISYSFASSSRIVSSFCLFSLFKVCMILSFSELPTPVSAPASCSDLSALASPLC